MNLPHTTKSYLPASVDQILMTQEILLIEAEMKRRGLIAERPPMTTPIWKPSPGPQIEAMHSEAFEVYFGGSAGGGKSFLLILLALTQHRKSIIFRREYPQLKEMIDESRSLLRGTTAKFNGQSMLWRGIPGGRQLEFGACQHEDDKHRYQGRPHDLKAFDEISAFSESQYRFLIGWARSTKKNQRVRVMACGNPPMNTDGEWVIRRWGAWLDPQHRNPAKHGELRWYAVIDGDDVEREDGQPFEWKGETIQPRSRTFIPARLSDNPYLVNTDYEATLQGLPEPLRSQLLYGDFNISVEDNPYQVIPTEWIRQAQRLWETSEKPDIPLSTLGCDVARGGKDQTILSKRYGHWYAPLIKIPGSQSKDGNAVATFIKGALEEKEQDTTIIIDIIGVGASPYDILVSNAMNVIGYNAASKSRATDKTGKLHFANKRAESWWQFREALDSLNGEGIALPPDPELLSDLCAPRWKLTARGIQVESKDEIIKRLGRSPDCGDAVVMAKENQDISKYLVFL